MSSELEQLRERFIETGGHITQSIGVGRVIGQVFAHIYFSPQPQTLDDLTRELQVSKGAASMSVRQLEQWGAVRQVWIKGERKDYFEACEDFGRIIRRALLDLIGRRMEATDTLLEQAEQLVAYGKRKTRNADEQFLARRIEKLRVFRNRAQYIWDSSIIKLLLK
jgi:HTH-type transcriptional regulator, glycine betaine synthesis regulator